MEIYANGDAPGANQMVEGPVIDPATDIEVVIDNLFEFGDSLIEWSFMDNIDIMIVIKMMFVMTVCHSFLMFVMTLHILERICSMVFKCANLILIGAAVTMGMIYVKRYFCPEAQTSFWKLLGLNKDDHE